MSRVVKMVAMALVLTVILTLGISGAAFASNYDGPGNPENPGIGPAPSFGDGDADGPEWEEGDIPNGPND